LQIPARIAVIGVGHLGQHHARIVHNLKNAQLVAVVDTDPLRGNEIARQLGVPHFTTLEEVQSPLDAVSIATPTISHSEIASAALERGCHVFIEKPITRTVEEARALIDLAENKGRIIQVGHIERFNSAVLDLKKFLDNPLFIECHRLGPFAPRVKDIGVVKDLMIHDLDLILSLVESEVLSVEAVGIPVLTRFEDIANARLRFANGCIANLTCSRVTPEQMRKIRFFQSDAYLSLDYQLQQLQIYRKIPAQDGSPPSIDRQILQMEKGNALERELEAFVGAILNGTPPVVTGRDGMKALALAQEISDQIHSRKEILHHLSSASQ